MALKTWSDLDYNERKALAEIYRAGNITSVLGNYGTKPGTLIRRIQEFLKYETDRQTATVQAIEIPKSPSRKWLDYGNIEADSFLVISDVEIPDHDETMLKLALLTAVRFGIKTLILGGDLLATDNASLATHPVVFKSDTEMPYESSVGIANQLLYQFGQHFEDIHCISGNHDERINKKTGGEVWIRMLLDDTKTTYYKYRYMYIRTSRGLVKVLHPENFSTNPVSLGRQMQAVDNGPVPGVNEKSHLILAHTHLQESGWSSDGDYEIHALGCTRDPYRTQYKQIKANKYRQWVQGFLMFHNSEFKPLTRKGTNWRGLLGEDLYRESGW